MSLGTIRLFMTPAKILNTVLLMLCLLFSAGTHSTSTSPQVLFVIGEPRAFAWNQKLASELEAAFYNTYANGTLYFEFLDLPNLPPSKTTALRDILVAKYKHVDLDAVVIDMQTTYSMLQKEGSFKPDIPQITLQYSNDYQVANERANAFFLPIQTNYKAMVEQAIKLADAKQIVFVGKANSQYEIMSLDNIKNELKGLTSSAKLRFINFTTMADLEQQSAKLDDNTVVILTPFFVNDGQRAWTPSQLSEHIALKFDLPLFVHWETMLNDAVAGGISISPKAISKEVLGAISNLLNNKKPYLNTHNIYNSHLNLQVAERFGLKLYALPPQTNVYNQPVSAFELFFSEIVIVTVLLSALLMASLVLFSWNRVLTRQQIEQHKEAKELSNAYERLRLAAGAAQIGIWEYAIDTQTLVWDDTMYKHHGQHKATFDVSLQTWFGVIYEQDETDFETNLLFAINNGKQLSQDYRVETDCGMRQLSINTDIVLSMNNKPVRLIGAVKDITNQTIYENRLKQERDKLLALSSTKADFVSGMGHEMRTPISTIIGASEFLLKADLEERDKGYVALLRNSAQKLSHTVNDLVDISKLESGKMNIEKYGFNIIDLIHKTVASQHVNAQKKHLKIHVDILENLPKHVVSDALRIKQVLNNLFDNAIKFTDLGYINLTVKFVVDKDFIDHGVLTFSLQDTGIGIPKSANEHIFEKFVQSKTNTFKKYGGTGLGLSISREIAIKLGGSLTVESEPHKGSLFTFTVPVTVSKQSEFPQARLSALRVPDLSGKRVLIVDDVETNRLVINQMLADTRVETSFAENGSDALEKFKMEKFDFILMDMLMPVMDGLEATKQIRTQHSELNSNLVPIISLAAQAIDGDEELCKEAGTNGYLTKPVNQSELFLTIDRLVG